MDLGVPAPAPAPLPRVTSVPEVPLVEGSEVPSRSPARCRGDVDDRGIWNGNGEMLEGGALEEATASLPWDSGVLLRACKAFFRACDSHA